MDSIVLIVIVVALVVVLAIAGVMLARRRRSENLQKNFGTEYERTVTESGDRKSAEAQLRDRERRHRDLDIRALRPEERDSFQGQWESAQQGFVDDPARALRHADVLVVEIMRTRGYPVDDFDRRADDISVAHPEVVHHYREAREVHEASTEGSVDTEKQRHALTSYRSLVDALLGRAEHDGRQAERDHDERPASGHDRHSANGHVDGAATDRPGTEHAQHAEHPEQTRRTEEQTR